MRWLAPAKINLFLHILGRRDDGYHELQTLFQFLDLCDEIELDSRADGKICLTTSIADVPAEEDLTVRAARLLKDEYAVRAGVDITVQKSIPVAAGLGGGSSDCASVLVGLNQLWRLGLSLGELASLGGRLGADVPVFVKGRAAWGEGVGALLTPVTLPEAWYLLIVPGCQVSTAEVFAAPALTRNSTPTTIRDSFGGVGAAGEPEADILHLLERTRNDCEALVRDRYPIVDAVFQWANRRGSARMTGTGGTVFIPADNQGQATQWLEQLPTGWQGFAAQGQNKSPTLEQVNRI